METSVTVSVNSRCAHTEREKEREKLPVRSTGCENTRIYPAGSISNCKANPFVSSYNRESFVSMDSLKNATALLLTLFPRFFFFFFFRHANLYNRIRFRNRSRFPVHTLARRGSTFKHDREYHWNGDPTRSSAPIIHLYF